MQFFKNYNLSIVLFILFAVSLAGQGYFQWQEFAIDQQEHNQPIKVEEFTPQFMSRMFENWQSEFLQLLTFVILTAYLIHKGSAESKDSDEEMMQKLTNIENSLKKIKK